CHVGKAKLVILGDGERVVDHPAHEHGEIAAPDAGRRLVGIDKTPLVIERANAVGDAAKYGLGVRCLRLKRRRKNPAQCGQRTCQTVVHPSLRRMMSRTPMIRGLLPYLDASSVANVDDRGTARTRTLVCAVRAAAAARSDSPWAWAARAKSPAP